jgi:hypothetical protein
MKGERMNNKAISGVLVLLLMLAVGLHSEASRGSDSDGKEELEKRKGAFKSILVNPVADFSKYSSVCLTAVVLAQRQDVLRHAPTATGSLVGKRSRKSVAPDKQELSELRRVVRETIVSEFGSMEGMELTLEPDAATLLLRASVTDMVFESSRKSEDGTRVPVLAQGVIEFELIDSETGLLVGRMFERRKCNARKRSQSTDEPIRLWSEVEPWVQQGAADLQGELSILGG